MLDVFEGTNTTIGMVSLTTMAVGTARGSVDVPLVVSMTTAIVKGKLLYFYAYSRYASKDDADWVRAQATAWLPRLRADN